MKLRGKLSGSDKRQKSQKESFKKYFFHETVHMQGHSQHPVTCALTQNIYTHTHSPADIPVMARVIYFSWCVLEGRGLSISVSVCLCTVVFMHVHPSIYVFVCVSVLHLGRVKELSGQITSLPLLGFLCLSVSAQMKICSTQITRVPSHRFQGNPSCLKPLVAVLFIVRECVRVCVCQWMVFFFFL